MGYAILRTQKLKSPVAVRRSMKHAFREQKTPNADETLRAENTHIGASSVEEGMAKFNERLPDKYRKDAVVAIEYLITASPESMAKKSRDEQDTYFQDALKWLKERHGAENVVYSGIHRDEKTPHMYAYVVPLDIDKEEKKLNARRYLGGSKALSQMQTDFYEQVGKEHGLSRGVEGSKARHQTVKQFYAEIQKPVEALDGVSVSEMKPQKKGLLKKESEFEVAERINKRIANDIAYLYRHARNGEMLEKKYKATQKAYENASQKLEKAFGEIESKHGLSLASLSTEQRVKLVMQIDAMRRENRQLSPRERMQEVAKNNASESKSQTWTKDKDKSKGIER